MLLHCGNVPIKSLSIYIVAFFLYDLMKKKIICLPTYPNFSDRVGSGETKIFLNVAWYKQDIDKLEKVQRKCLKLCPNEIEID